MGMQDDIAAFLYAKYTNERRGNGGNPINMTSQSTYLKLYECIVIMHVLIGFSVKVVIFMLANSKAYAANASIQQDYGCIRT